RAEGPAGRPLRHPRLGLDQHAVLRHRRFDVRLPHVPAGADAGAAGPRARRPAHGLRCRGHRPAALGGGAGAQPADPGHLSAGRRVALRPVARQPAHLGDARAIVLRDAAPRAAPAAAQAARGRAMSRRHWADLGETTFVGGTWFVYAVDRLLGRLPFRICLYPVVFCWWLGSGVARRASLDYLRRLHAAEGVFPRRPGMRESLRHFLLFGETLLDKMLAIGGRYPRGRIDFSGHEPMLAASRAGQGGIIATAHMGCLELMQMSARWREGLRVTILVHTAHAQRFNEMLGRLN